MSDRKAFYDEVREELDTLTQGQVDGLEVILNKWDELKLTDIRYLAYLLATTYHETARTFQPIKEMGGLKYLKSKPYYPYFGRGLVQITWKKNYEKYGIADHPDDALKPEIAAHIAFDGMIHGIFTGKKLADYFNASKNDPYNARRIINGLDKAGAIAGYYEQFLNAAKHLTPPEPVAQVKA